MEGEGDERMGNDLWDTRISSTSLIRCHAHSPTRDRLLISAHAGILWRCISAHGPELSRTSFLFYSERKQLALPSRYRRHTLSPSLFLSGHSPEERAAKFCSPSAPFSARTARAGNGAWPRSALLKVEGDISPPRNITR